MKRMSRRLSRTVKQKLSEEEISALKLEGIDPSEYQKGKLWTKTQEKVLKRIRRKIRNKPQIVKDGFQDFPG